jgi:hypothetical protein
VKLLFKRAGRRGEGRGEERKTGSKVELRLDI